MAVRNTGWTAKINAQSTCYAGIHNTCTLFARTSPERAVTHRWLITILLLAKEDLVPGQSEYSLPMYPFKTNASLAWLYRNSF